MKRVTSKLDLTLLIDFATLAKTRSFSKSAEERNITQPAFSRRIRSLEEWLGVELVDRGSYPSELTDAGKTFQAKADEIWQLLNDAREELRRRHSQAQATVTFAALHTLALTFFPTWLGRVEARGQSFVTRLTADNFQTCVQSLVTGGCDFLLSFSHPMVEVFPDSWKFPSMVVGRDTIIPATGVDRNGEPLFRLPGSADASIPYLSYSSDNFLGRVTDMIAHRPAVRTRLSKVYENSMAEALRAMVLQGYGLAWLPKSCVQVDIARGRLALGGDEAWQQEVEIRLYCAADRLRSESERFWRLALDLAGEDGLLPSAARKGVASL